MADVFLSYSRQDLERAKKLVRLIEERGYTVYWDRRLLPGDGFRHEIATQLDAARAVVVIWSKHSVDSAWVIDEAECGRSAGRLVSACVDEVQPPLGFRQVHAAALSDWDGQGVNSEMELLIEGVGHLVGRAPKRIEPREVEIRPARPEPPVPTGGAAQPTVNVPKQGVGASQSRPAGEALVHPLRKPQLEAGSWWERMTGHVALKPTLLLLVVFVVNYIQTTGDALLTPAALGAEGGYPIADAFRWFEQEMSFEFHDVAGPIAYVGYSVAYFLLFPIVCIGVAVALARRSDPLPYRAFCLAIAINYVVSLPFFFLFPVPERWAFPGTGAMLLSDKWSDSLIEAIRPISGLDNCFPSFHTSLSVLVTTACWIFGVRFRVFTTMLCVSVVLATFALGIHWLPDIIAGVAIGAGSLLLAVRCLRRGPQADPAPARSGKLGSALPGVPTKRPAHAP